MIDESIVQQIVESFLKANQEKNILEVGPGKGALTKYLLNAPNNFKAVEADWDMLHYLLTNLDIDGEQIIRDDFLRLPLDRVFDNESFSVIGNFPYNISSQILFRVLKYKDLVPTVVGMFQKEVAHRIASKEGSKVYGVTSVLIQSVYDVKILFDVDPNSFVPAPKVTSTVILLERKANYELPCDEKLFKNVVKASFLQRRKMLRNSVKAFIKTPEMQTHEYMTRRPEQMSLEDYYILTNLIENQEK